MHKKLLILTVAFFICSMIMLLLLVLLFTTSGNNWLGGKGCLYDEEGFIELTNGEVHEKSDGTKVKCINGKIEFE